MAEVKLKLSSNRYSDVCNLQFKNNNNVNTRIDNLIVEKDGVSYGVYSRGVEFDTRTSADIPRIGFGTKIHPNNQYKVDSQHIYTRYNSNPYGRPVGGSKIYIPYIQETLADPRQETDGNGLVTYVFPIWYLPVAAESDFHNRIKNSINGGQIIKMQNTISSIDGIDCYVYTKALSNITSSITGLRFPYRGWANSQWPGPYTKSYNFSSSWYGSNVENNKIFYYNFESANSRECGFGSDYSKDSNSLAYFKVTISASVWSEVRCSVDYLNQFGERVVVDNIRSNTQLKVLCGSIIYLTPTVFNDNTEECFSHSYARALVTNNETENITINCGLFSNNLNINTVFPNYFHVRANCNVDISRISTAGTAYSIRSKYIYARTWTDINTVSPYSCKTVWDDRYSWDSSSAAPSSDNYNKYRSNRGNVWWALQNQGLSSKFWTTPNCEREAELYTLGSAYMKIRFTYNENGFIIKISMYIDASVAHTITGKLYLS